MLGGMSRSETCVGQALGGWDRQRKIDLEDDHAPPHASTEPHFYDRQAFIAIKPTPWEVGQVLDEMTVGTSKEFGYRDVVLLP